MARARKRTEGRVARALLLVLVPVSAILFLLPLLWFAMTSLKTRPETLTSPFGLPSDPQWGNFLRAWDEGGLGIYFPNSVVYAVGIALGVAIFSTAAGYSLARIEFRGQNVILAATFVLMTVPFQSTMIPLRGLVEFFGLSGTWWALIVPVVAREIPFGIFLMRGFFRGLPEEIAHAARVDGCGEWTVFRRIMLPLALPGVLTLILLEVVFSWKLLLEPLVLVQSAALRPVVAGISLFTGQYGSDAPLIAAATLIASVPIIVLTLLLQRQFVAGITAGSQR